MWHKQVRHAPGPVLFSCGTLLSVYSHADLRQLKTEFIEDREVIQLSQNLQFSYFLLFFIVHGPAQQYVDTGVPVSISGENCWLSVNGQGRANGRLKRLHPIFMLRSVCVFERWFSALWIQNKKKRSKGICSLPALEYNLETTKRICRQYKGIAGNCAYQENKNKGFNLCVCLREDVTLEGQFGKNKNWIVYFLDFSN